MIKVLIATCNRPDMLKTALQSVADQTIYSQIGSVVVSENGGNRQSSSVCAEFPSLPINYFFRDPPVAPLEHARILFSEATTEKYTAILHDDDWWAPRHLEIAFNALESNPHCSATFSNSFASIAPKYPYEVDSRIWFLWAAVPSEFHHSLIELDISKVLIASLLNTTFHFSTSFCRSIDFVVAGKQMVSTKNSFDCDRTFPVFCAEKGPILFISEPTAYIRQHDAQASRRSEYQKEFELKAQTTISMLKLWPDECKIAADTFNQKMLNLPYEWQLKLSARILEPHKSVLIQKCGFNLISDNHKNKPSFHKKRRLKWTIKQLTPHGIICLFRKIKASCKVSSFNPIKLC
jgi:hypothetical protein